MIEVNLCAEEEWVCDLLAFNIRREIHKVRIIRGVVIVSVIVKEVRGCVLVGFCNRRIAMNVRQVRFNLVILGLEIVRVRSRLGRISVILLGCLLSVNRYRGFGRL
jgi:hypothetical protein